jgi:GTP cyclohydrolase IIa
LFTVVHKVALISLKGYREWTESLGPRREHIIQQTQAELQADLWRTFTAIGALPHHFRHDFFIALTTNIDEVSVTRAVGKIARKSPVPVEHCTGVGDTPYEAYLNCGEDRAKKQGGLAAVAHMDVVNSSEVTKSNGPLKIYLEILDLLNNLARRCRDVGCLAFYLGGDNIALFLPNAESIRETVDGLSVPVRVGVGVAKRPYNAFVKATRGLDHLRSLGKIGVKIVR